MSTQTQLAKIENTNIDIWGEENLASLKEMFAADLTAIEFKIFMNLGKCLNANPFTREIWAVKYDKTKPASIFCGRDFYRKRGQSQPDYIWHTAQPVFENDIYEENCGTLVKHTPNIKEPGRLIMAYCLIKRKERPDFFLKVFLNEYNLGFSQWKTKPVSMLCKVAEAQAFRQAYQGVFEGTYSEDEQVEKTIDIKPEPEETKEHVFTIGEIMKVITPEVQVLARELKLSQKAVIDLWNMAKGDQKTILDTLQSRAEEVHAKTENEVK